jgi:acetate kinase
MTTRSGSVDPGALLYLLRERALSVDELDHALEHESGLAGLSGTSGDVRDLDEGSLALAVYVHRVAAAVAASAAALGGPDAIAFTGGIGENSALVRDRCASGCVSSSVRGARRPCAGRAGRRAARARASRLDARGIAAIGPGGQSAEYDRPARHDQPAGHPHPPPPIATWLAWTSQ